ncbi:MAG: toxin-antitoxin system HicB family antitoxin [Synergistaceae bacterium]|nr:toxin-antitoxin system HicB family antitoxin [Synergistaceae bacterium]MBR0075524.1 toxin-antitoxin system HicB family antitoxin [Synergistaceae bacterium]
MSQLTLRLPDEIHTKVRVLAAFKNVSQNDLLIQAAQELINRWEQKHGNLPLPPEDID